MTVRREIAEPSCETARGDQGTGSAVFGSACPAPRTGTVARKKGASPQQYVDGPRGEAAGEGCHSSGSAIAAEPFMNNAG
jgi:hypothetical protein